MRGDLGHTIRVTVAFTDDDGYAETLTSDATATVVRQTNASPSGQPAVSGVLAVGKTLTADTSGITDPNGLSNPAFTHQWVRSIGGADTDILGATGSSYTLASGDEGAAFKVTVAFTDDDGYAETLTSGLTQTVMTEPEPKPGERTERNVPRDADTLVGNTGQTTLSTSYVVGVFLTAKHSSAIRFTTGSATNDYTITEASIKLTSIGLAAVPKLSIYTSASSVPGTLVFTFTNPGSLVDGLNTFTAPASSTLTGSTDYFVVIEGTATGDMAGYRISTTASTTDDAGAATGWSLGDSRLARIADDGAWGDQGTDPIPQVAIKGSALADTTAPTLSTATVDGTTLVLTYNEPLDEDSVPAAAAYSVVVGLNSAVAPSSVSISGSAVTLTLATAVTDSDTVAIVYTVPSTGPVQDAAGNDAAALSNQAVTNATALALSTATVDGASLVLTYDDSLDTGSVPAAGAYSVTVGGNSAAPSSVSISGSAVTLTLATAATFGDTVTLTYTVPSTNPVQDAAGNDAAALSSQAVSNATLNLEPTFNEGATTMRSVDENSGAGVDIGTPVAATDIEGHDLLYTLVAADSIFFSFNQSSGQIMTKSGVDYDYEARDSYSVTILVRDSLDADGNDDISIDDSITVTINVNNLDEQGQITISPAGPPTGGDTLTASLTDPDGATTDLDWQWSRATTLGGTYNDIPGATDAAYTPVAADVGKFLSVSVEYDDPQGDGKDTAHRISTAVAAGNTDPSFSAETASHTLNENSPPGTAIRALTTLVDTEGDTLTYSLAGPDQALFAQVAVGMGIPGQVLRTASGSAFDFESPGDADNDNVYELTWSVSDGKDAAGNTDASIDDTLAITVTVVNLDENGTVTIAGTLSGGETLTASVTDPDGMPTNVVWEWARSDDDFETIAGTTATRRLVAADVGSTLRARARYTDPQGPGKSRSARTSDAIAASNTAPTFDDGTEAARDVPENSPVGAEVGDPVTATDGNGDTLIYSLAGADASLFSIDSASGQIKADGVLLNYEVRSTYNVTVSVHDGKDAAGDADTSPDATIAVAITVTDVNEAPVITPTGITATFVENTPASTTIKVFAATDVDEDSVLSWTVESADDGDLFEINSNGELTFKTSPDYESPADADAGNTYNVTVKVTDNGISGMSTPTASDTLTFHVTVTNANEAPVITTTNQDAPTFDENASGVVATYVATDVDANSILTWSLEGNDAGQFNINPATGALSFKNAPDYEMPDDTGGDNIYDITVKVSDNHSPQLSATLDVTVTVNDVNETSETIKLTVTAFPGVEGGRNQGNTPVQGQEFGNVVFRFNLDAPAAVPISMDLETVDGAAVRGDDYRFNNPTLVFPAGQTEMFIKLPVIDDADFDGARNEDFDLVASNPSVPVFTGQLRATGYILDNETPPPGVDYVDDSIRTDAYIDVGESWVEGNAVVGGVEHRYDQDWYRTVLQANRCYQIEVRGKDAWEDFQEYPDDDPIQEYAPAQELTLSDPLIHGVYTDLGNYMPNTQEEYGGSGLGAVKVVTIDQTGTVYIAVSHAWYDEGGAFDLSLIDLGRGSCTRMDPSVTDAWASITYRRHHSVSEGEGRDLPQDISTTGYVQPDGDPATGNIETDSDADYFKVPLVAGRSYRIDVKGDEESDYGGTLDNPFVILNGSTGVSLDSQSEELASFTGDRVPHFVEDRNSGRGNNARLEVEVNVTDTYFIVVRENLSSNTGTYTVVVTTLPN